MSRYIRHFRAPLALAFALTAVACADNGAGDTDTTLTQDSALNRDLELANKDSAAQPALTDVPPAAAPEPTPSRPKATASRPKATTPRPSTTTPAPSPTTKSGNTVTPGTAGSEGTLGTIAAGTQLTLRSASKVCTNSNRVGDRFTATVTEAVTGSNGATIPAGATAVIEITSLKKSENARDNIAMGFAVRSISFGGKTYNIDADVTTAQVDRVRSSSTGNDAKKVIGGAVIGAVIGQVIGKDTKGTVIGAATGAAAGAGAAAATADYDGCVNDGGRITIKLNAPATVQA